MKSSGDKREPEPAGPPQLLLDRVVVFRLGDQRYAFPLECVREVQQIVAFAEVPSGDSGIVGMVNLRGTVIPAIDVRRLVGMEVHEYVLETPMIIAQTHGEKMALIVDEVEDVFELSHESLQGAPARHKLSAMMLGVAPLGEGLVYVLDVGKLLAAAPKAGLL